MHRIVFTILISVALSGCAQQDVGSVARGAGTILINAVAQSEVDRTLGRNETMLRQLTTEQRDYCEHRGNCLALPAGNPAHAMQQIRDNRSFYQRYQAETAQTTPALLTAEPAVLDHPESVVIQRPAQVPASATIPALSKD
ncbi:MAG: hypothetical protein AAAFM81_01945 [Pseudomonadota bacterium]